MMIEEQEEDKKRWGELANGEEGYDTRYTEHFFDGGANGVVFGAFFSIDIWVNGMMILLLFFFLDSLSPARFSKPYMEYIFFIL